MSDNENNLDEAPAFELLSKVLEENPYAELRPQQQEMISLVNQSITKSEPALIQAGTGVGKSLGYIIPLVVNDQKAIICTATKHLSEQLIYKDLPIVAKARKDLSGKDMKYSLLKGLSNYLCLKKYNDLLGLSALSGKGPSSEEEKSDPMLDIGNVMDEPKVQTDLELKDEYALLYEWAETTDVGDRSEAPGVSNKAWEGFSTDSNDCPGKVCPFYKDCYGEIAKRKAAKADIVVTNHSLVAYSLAYGQDFVSGERDILIVDEIHDFEKYLTDGWGAELTAKGILDFIALISKDKSYELNHLIKNIVDITESSQKVIALLNETEKTQLLTLTEHAQLLNLLAQLANIIGMYAKKVSEALEYNADNKEFVSNATTLYKRASGLVSRLSMILDIDNDDFVQWVELIQSKKNKNIVKLKAAPLDVSETLYNKLEENEVNFIGTSATIKVGDDFGATVRKFGLDRFPSVVTKDVGTPFEYNKQGILYVPSKADIPEPLGAEREEHSKAVQIFAKNVLDKVGGRTLILCTTQKSAQDIGEYLKNNTDVPNVLIQGTKPNKALVEEFMLSAKDSVLLATMGMWHGLDIPGYDLSVVIIDKIPFAPMDDILTKAKMQRIKNKGGDPFNDIYLNEAIINLMQGTGRLIRRSNDKGVVAILDPRINTKNYGRLIKSTLPDFWFTSNSDTLFKSLDGLMNNINKADIDD